MSVEVGYLLKKDEPRAVLRELDDVSVLVPVLTDDGETIAAGTEGTIVAVVRPGETFIIEFPEPVGALADVEAVNLLRIGRHAR